MPRLLWLGLILCVAVLLGALALMRKIESKEERVASTSAHAAAELRPIVDPAGDSNSGPNGRSAVAALAPDVAGSAASEPNTATRIEDLGYHGSAIPDFRDGVVEVRVVRDEDGTPIRDASVTIDFTNGGETNSTDALGLAVFTNVGLPVRVTASATGRPPVSRSVLLGPGLPRASVELRAFVERELTVRVLDPNGAPFRPEDWGIDVSSAQRVGILLTNRCGALGQPLDFADVILHSARSVAEFGAYAWRVRVRGAVDGCIDVFLGDVTIGTHTIVADETEIGVRVDPSAIDSALAPIVVCVLDAITGSPIAGAQAEFRKVTTREPRMTTGHDGCLRVPLARASRTTAIVRAPGYAAAKCVIERPIPDRIVVRLKPGRRVAGRVVDQNGAPLAGVRVTLKGLDLARDASTGPDGTFEIAEAPAAEFEVEATYSLPRPALQSQRVTAAADCRAGDALGIELRVDTSKTYDPSVTGRR